MEKSSQRWAKKMVSDSDLVVKLNQNNLVKCWDGHRCFWEILIYIHLVLFVIVSLDFHDLSSGFFFW